MITASDALQILDALTSAGVRAWVDGGWGVDALLGEQTREHEDLDLVIALDDAENASRALSLHSFSLTEDERPTRFVLANADGRHIDFHTVVFDAEGGGVQRLQDGRSYRYPPEGFVGHGTIAGRPTLASRRKSSSSATSATNPTKRTATTCAFWHGGSASVCRRRTDVSDRGSIYQHDVTSREDHRQWQPLLQPRCLRHSEPAACIAHSAAGSAFFAESLRQLLARNLALLRRKSPPPHPQPSNLAGRRREKRW